jgi:hypothetical protein
MVKDDGVELTIPTFTHQTDDPFLSMVHVALRIRGDMVSHPKPDVIEICEDRAIYYVPDSLYMFLNLLLGGVSHHVTSSMKHVNELLRTCCLVKSTSHSNVLGVVILSPLAV